MYYDELQKIKLTTDHYGGLHKLPNDGELYYEVLTVDKYGRVWYTQNLVQEFESQCRLMPKIKRLPSLSEEKTMELFMLIEKFVMEYEEELVDDGTYWYLDLTYEDKEKFSLSGIISDDIIVDNVNLSDWLRKELNLPHYHAFDGNIA